MSVIELASKMTRNVMGTHGCIFTFHRVAQASAWADLPNRDFYIDLDFLDALLAHLARTGCTVVTVSEMLERLQRPPAGGSARLVNFSIDDCYRDTYELLVPLFRARNVPLTLYVTSDIPDGTHLLPWIGLEQVLATRSDVNHRDQRLSVATAEARRVAFQSIWQSWEISGDVTGCYLAFCASNGADPATLRDEARITWDMLHALARDPLVEIGAHSKSHPRISELGVEGAREEIAGSASRLEQVLGRRIEHFAFPYGRSKDCGPRDFALVREAGLASAATTRKGLCLPGLDPYNLPRNTLNGRRKSLAMAEASLSGLSGLAAQVLGRV
jgi:peptidoglycan/xylan/chitin deacetylase (PgdA/CDA1 family)